MRVFAGPNGSGKTTLINSLKSKISFGVYVNADDIEKQLKQTNKISFFEFKLNVEETKIKAFFKESTFSSVKRNEPDLWTKLSVIDNALIVNSFIDSYLAADLSDFIRKTLLELGISFTYETVMSHSSKIDFLKVARKNNFKVYTYFISTEDPKINISRVNSRVSQNGHNVSPNVIQNRYYKSLQNLKDAVINSNRAYIWDNSGVSSILISEITDGIDVEIFDIENTPNWFMQYLVDKK